MQDLIKKGYTSQNIKEEKITAEQLDEMKVMMGSYEALFSSRALKYKAMGLKDKNLTEKDYRDLILAGIYFSEKTGSYFGKENLFRE